MSTLRKVCQLLGEHGWLIIAICWWGSIFCSGYVLAGAVKEWAKTHIIFVHETCTTDSNCEGVE